MKFSSCKTCAALLTGGGVGGGSAYGATASIKGGEIKHLRDEVNELNTQVEEHENTIENLRNANIQEAKEKRNAMQEVKDSKGINDVHKQRDTHNWNAIQNFLKNGNRATANCEWSYQHNTWQNWNLNIYANNQLINIPLELWGCFKNGYT